MRTLRDRIRHTLLFEVIALGVGVVGGSWILGRPVEIIGALSLMFSGLAMGWNMLFNWLFDLWDQKYRGSAKRGFVIRAAHASLFELGMVIPGIFLVAWWLSISYWQAFIIDIGFSALFLFYAYGFNWAYDHVFPVPKEA
ncbi:MAG: PACE efflux transporter [Magnetovibrio sp.]|nr:PACE efflux transporter [Magnetovibrio sp.]